MSNNAETPPNVQSDQPVVQPEVKNELSKVASNPKRNILVFLLLVGIIGSYAVSMYRDSNKNVEVKPSKVEAKTIVQPNEASNSNNMPIIPQLPEPPKVEAPKAPPLPPMQVADKVQAPILPPLPSPQQQIVTAPNIKVAHKDEENDKKMRLKSTIVKIGGSAPEGGATLPLPEGRKVLNVTYLGNPEYLIAKGKVIDAVLETSITSDGSGLAKAVISRDIYAEKGRRILIPKGSVVTGKYQGNSAEGQTKIMINWEDIMLSNGYVVKLNSQATDNLGNPGVGGYVDSQYPQKFFSSILSTSLDILLADTMDRIVKPVQNTTSSGTLSQLAQAALNQANTIFTQSGGVNTDPVFFQICESVKKALLSQNAGASGANINAYNQINQYCNTPTNQPSGNANGVGALMVQINSTFAQLTQTAVNDTVQTNAQKAAQTGLTNISNTVKDVLKNEVFNNTVTVFQGTAIKILSNDNIIFPEAALNNNKLIE